MLGFLKQVGDYAKESYQAAKYIGQGLSVTFDHMKASSCDGAVPLTKS